MSFWGQKDEYLTKFSKLGIIEMTRLSHENIKSNTILSQRISNKMAFKNRIASHVSNILSGWKNCYSKTPYRSRECRCHNCCEEPQNAYKPDIHVLWRQEENNDTWKNMMCHHLLCQAMGVWRVRSVF